MSQKYGHVSEHAGTVPAKDDTIARRTYSLSAEEGEGNAPRSWPRVGMYKKRTQPARRGDPGGPLSSNRWQAAPRTVNKPARMARFACLGDCERLARLGQMVVSSEVARSRLAVVLAFLARFGSLVVYFTMTRYDELVVSVSLAGWLTSVFWLSQGK